MPSRTPPNIDLNRFAGEHLFYEVQMFVAALGVNAYDQLPMNFKIEVCVLHLRNLIDFFYLSNPLPDDVIAADYVTDWEKKRPPMATILDKARTRANKELHHLTTQRIAGTPGHKEWDFTAIRNQMKRVVKAFIDLKPNIPQNTISELLKI